MSGRLEQPLIPRPLSVEDAEWARQCAAKVRRLTSLCDKHGHNPSFVRALTEIARLLDGGHIGPAFEVGERTIRTGGMGSFRDWCTDDPAVNQEFELLASQVSETLEDCRRKAGLPRWINGQPIERKKSIWKRLFG